MAKKRIYELLNKAVLTVSDLFMIDKSGDVNATNVSGQQIVDLVDANIVRVETVSGTAVDNTDPLNPIIDSQSLAFTDLTDVPTDYTGEGGKYVMVALTEDGLVFNTVATSDTNIYNTNGTLTGNRTVNGGGFTLNFFDASVKYKGIGSIFSELVSYRNLSNSADTVTIYNDGKVYFYQDFRSFGVNYMETIRSPYFSVSGLSISNGVIYNSRGELGMNYVSHDFKTENNITTLGVLAQFRNFNTVHFTIRTNGVINCPTMPTSAAGLSSGDIWSDSGTLKIV